MYWSIMLTGKRGNVHASSNNHDSSRVVVGSRRLSCRDRREDEKPCSLPESTEVQGLSAAEAHQNPEA